MAISMLKIRRPLGRLIFNMGIAIAGKTVFLIETPPPLVVMDGHSWNVTFYVSTGPVHTTQPLPPVDSLGIWSRNIFLELYLDKFKHLTILRLLSFVVINSHTVHVSFIKMWHILFGNKINKTKLISNVDLH